LPNRPRAFLERTVAPEGELLQVNRRLRRFFITGPLVAGWRRLEGTEAHHLVHVLRIGLGDMVRLFDGRGGEAAATVTGCAAGTVELTVGELQVEIDDGREVILAAAVPKGDRFGWMIEKATELGVARFVPLITERSVVIPGQGKLDKMRRTIVEASKQCGRPRLMELAVPALWSEFVGTLLGPSAGWVADPAGEPFDAPDMTLTGPVVAAIGPEGGLTSAELELAVGAGAKLISLGPRILRIETAALALAALLTCPGTSAFRG
jgi:16S rRNA (uracil1498-N3)-methyltransferase